MTETSKREVNTDEEVLDLEDESEEAEATEEEDLDEDVVAPDQIPPKGTAPEETGESEEEPGESDEGDEEQESEEEASATKSSPEGTEAEGEKPADTAPSKPPAPVPGETPREKALRLEVQRVKGLLRQKSVSEIVENPRAEPGVATDAVAQLKQMGYTDEEIKNMDKAVDLIVQSKGYVKESHNYQTVVNEEVVSFMKDNPEYKPDNDPEDVRWETFKRHLTGGLYNINGRTRDQLRTIFAKVKKDVDAELGLPATEALAEANATEARKKAAQTQKIKSVSHSGGTKAPASKTKKPVDPEVRKMFKGFEDEDLA